MFDVRDEIIDRIDLKPDEVTPLPEEKLDVYSHCVRNDVKLFDYK